MIENIHNNEQVLQQIEWDLLIKELKKSIHFDETLNYVLKPLDSKKAAKKYHDTLKFNQLLEKLDYYDMLASFKLIDSQASFVKVVEAIKKSQARKLKEVNELILCVELYLSYYFDFTDLNLVSLDKDSFHKFKQSFQKKFLKNFRHFVSKDGEINFENHPKLKPLYLKQIEIEQKIRSILSKSIHHDEISSALQFSSFDLINDHYVIPLKSGAYKAEFGQIVSRSESGHTLYVEPTQIQNLNQKRLECIIEIQEIIAKIELETIESLSFFLSELEFIKNLTLQFDDLFSRYNFGVNLNLRHPSISKERQIIIKGFFHPLIRDPVLNDFELTFEKAGFIISGPNTGGKTATLKSMAIIQLFLKYALPLPCKSADVFLYENVFYFGNDQQQLEEGLSSFSAEVKNYIHLFESLGKSNLILIDEIFNSTSSEEASALAMAIFHQLKSLNNNHVIVSSHHQTLKTIMHQNHDYISAHVGFDTSENQPTYKIHIGAPGSSFALNIFQSMTKENSNFNNLYEKSLQYLDNKAIHYEKLLESISQKENQLNKLLLENKQVNNELKNQKNSMQGIIKLKTDEKIAQTQKELDKILNNAQAILNDTKNHNISNKNKLHKKINELKSKVNKHSPFNEEEHDKDIQPNLYDPDSFTEGEYYFCLLVNKTVLLKKLYEKKNEAHVSVGNMTLKCPLNTLKVANKKPKKNEQVSIHVDRSVNSKLEYDCRGMRLSEFEDLVQKHISDLLVGDIPFLNIIHGHGDGVLKSWLRKYIKNHEDLTMDKSEDGNDGSTRIILS